MDKETFQILTLSLYEMMKSFIIKPKQTRVFLLTKMNLRSVKKAKVSLMGNLIRRGKRNMR
jgi:hypothetical protein